MVLALIQWQTHTEYWIHMRHIVQSELCWTASQARRLQAASCRPAMLSEVWNLMSLIGAP